MHDARTRPPQPAARPRRFRAAPSSSSTCCVLLQSVGSINSEPGWIDRSRPRGFELGGARFSFWRRVSGCPSPIDSSPCIIHPSHLLKLNPTIPSIDDDFTINRPAASTQAGVGSVGGCARAIALEGSSEPPPHRSRRRSRGRIAVTWCPSCCSPSCCPPYQ